MIGEAGTGYLQVALGVTLTGFISLIGYLYTRVGELQNRAAGNRENIDDLERRTDRLEAAVFTTAWHKDPG